MSYPILYQAGETNFNHLGLGILKDTISAVVSEDLNGKFELDLVYAYNNRLSKSLVSGNIIKVDAGNVLKEQLFTIGQVSKTLDGKISVHAEHVSYIAYDLTLKPKTTTLTQNGQGALNQFVKAIKETDHGITVYSDVTTLSSSVWAVPDFKTPRDVLGGVDGSILDNWGGEYKFDNRRISLLEQRGSYANTVIAYGRNLLDFEQETSILETYTSIYPIVVKTEKDVEVTNTLPELAVDSQYLDKYANRKSFLVDFSDKFDDKNPYSDDKLRVLANAYIKANKVGIPKVTMTIKTLDLAKMVTEDYKAGRVERLDLADTVKVYFDRLGITTEAKVVGVKWNVLKDSYDEYVLGERKSTLNAIIKKGVAEVKSVAESAKKNAIIALISADSKNTNYYGNSSDGAPPNPKNGDMWFVKDGDKTTVKTWNGTSWIEIISTDWQKIFEEKLTEELAKAKVDLDAKLAEKDVAIKQLDAKLVANDEIIKQTQTDLSANKTAIDSVSKDLATNTQDQIVLKASLTQLDEDLKKTAQDVSTATTSIATVKTEVGKATTIANDAVTKADQNIKEIGELDIKLIDTKTLTDKALADVNKIAAENKVLVDKAQVDATKAITDAKTAYDKAVENSGKIVTVNQNVDKIKGEITTKVEKTDFDKSLGRITQAESSITQNANAITQKVSSTDVENILTGKAYATKSELTQTSDSLTSTISGVRTDLDGLGANTAYAYSPDGTDRFTTVYPNLNLLSLSSVKIGQYLNWSNGLNLFNNSNLAVFDYIQVTPNQTYTLSSSWNGWYISVFGYSDKTSSAKYILTSGKMRPITGSGFSESQNVTFTVPSDCNYLRVQIGNDSTNTSASVVKSVRVKIELGSTATPWMPSKTEVKPSDYPTYVGRSLKYSNIPSDYKWEIDSGYTDAKTVVQQTQISQMVQDLNGFKTTVSDTYLTTANASNTYPTKDTVSGTYLNKGDASNTYPTKTTVTSQINQSATDITNSVQSWTNGKLNGYSTIQQTNDSITSTITGVQVEIDKKANQSQVTQLSQDLSGFKTTVSSTYLNKTGASNTYPTKDAVANTYPTKTTVATQISQSATDITNSVHSWTNGRLTDYSTIQQTNNSITSAVSGKADRSQVTQLSDQISSIVLDKADRSQITQLATDINLRVTKDDIVNQINLSDDGFLISANKLTLDIAGNMIFNSEFNSNNFDDGFFQTGSLLSNFYESIAFYTDSTGAKSQNIGINSLTETDKTTSYWKRWNQDNRAKEGFVYSASAILRTANTNLIGSGIMLYLSFLDKDKNYLTNYSSATKTTEGYELFKIENVTAPSGTSYIRYAIIAKGLTQSYATRLMLNQGVKVAPYNASTGAIYVSGNMIVDGAVTASALAAEAVIAGKIATNAVTSATIASEAITTAKLAAGAVTATTIAANAVISDKIATNAITAVKIATNAVTADKISVNDLAAINGDLGTLTAGVIDAAVVTVKNINASNVTTGTLNASRIAANSITATHISISSLSSLSANLGTVTAGTINAATVNIINLNANSITTGTLNAAMINVINLNASNITTGSLNAKLLTGTTAYLQSVNTGNIYNDYDYHLQVSSKGLFNKTTNVGQLNLHSTQSGGSDWDAAFPGSMTYHFETSKNGQNTGLRFWKNHIMSLNSDQNSGLYLNPYGGTQVRVTSRTDDNTYLAINASAFNVASDRKFKSNIRDYDADALEIIKSLRIRKYKKSGKSEIGIIADEVDDTLLLKEKDGDFLSLYDYISIAVKAIQEQNVIIEDLMARTA